MMAFIEELAAGVAIALGVRAVTALAELLFVAEKNANPDRPQTCSGGGTVASADAPLHQDDSTRTIPQ
jgi:hypothetical protein